MRASDRVACYSPVELGIGDDPVERVDETGSVEDSVVRDGTRVIPGVVPGEVTSEGDNGPTFDAGAGVDDDLAPVNEAGRRLRWDAVTLLTPGELVDVELGVGQYGHCFADDVGLVDVGMWALHGIEVAVGLSLELQAGYEVEAT